LTLKKIIDLKETEVEIKKENKDRFDKEIRFLLNLRKLTRKRIDEREEFE